MPTGALATGCSAAPSRSPPGSSSGPSARSKCVSSRAGRYARPSASLHPVDNVRTFGLGLAGWVE